MLVRIRGEYRNVSIGDLMVVIDTSARRTVRPIEKINRRFRMVIGGNLYDWEGQCTVSHHSPLISSLAFPTLQEVQTYIESNQPAPILHKEEVDE